MTANNGASARRNPYLETRLKTASTLELTAILYDIFVESLSSAAEAAQTKRIEDRVRWTNRAMSALTELRCSLDHEKGGDLATRLDSLYAYASSRLGAAAFGDTAPELWSLVGLFEPLRQAWHEAATTYASDSKPAERPAERRSPTAALALAGMSA